MILHVANLDKFIPPFINFVNKRFNSKEHIFYIHCGNKSYKIEEENNLKLSKAGFLSSIRHFFSLSFQLMKAEKIILHGLFDVRLLFLLTLMPWIHSKCYWVLWGGDYLGKKYANRNYKFWIKEVLRKLVIPRIGNLITYIPGSIEIVREWYGAKGEFHECLAYTSNVYDGKFDPAVRGGSEINVLIGNSATETNQHLDAFKRVLPFFNENIRIYCPLSYGDRVYARKVISEGRRYFGDNFIPLKDFIPVDEYEDLMRNIDVVIFNHNRHQAMGNIINFLGMGKRVYLNKNIASWDFLNSKGLIVFCIDELKCLSPGEPIIENHKVVKEYFSYQNLEKQWFRIFNEY